MRIIDLLRSLREPVIWVGEGSLITQTRRIILVVEVLPGGLDNPIRFRNRLLVLQEEIQHEKLLPIHVHISHSKSTRVRSRFLGLECLHVDIRQPELLLLVLKNLFVIHLSIERLIVKPLLRDLRQLGLAVHRVVLRRLVFLINCENLNHSTIPIAELDSHVPSLGES